MQNMLRWYPCRERSASNTNVPGMSSYSFSGACSLAAVIGVPPSHPTLAPLNMASGAFAMRGRAAHRGQFEARREIYYVITVFLLRDRPVSTKRTGATAGPV